MAETTTRAANYGLKPSNTFDYDTNQTLINDRRIRYPDRKRMFAGFITIYTS